MIADNAIICKIILLFILLTVLVSGTDQASLSERQLDSLHACLHYGHSCWGGHGKRNGEENNLMKKLISAQLNEHKTSKLMKQPNYKFLIYPNQLYPCLTRNYPQENLNDNVLPLNTNQNDILQSSGNIMAYLKSVNPETKLNLEQKLIEDLDTNEES